jgi:alpha-beta hydrolase superfamily lysophospholipase
MRIVRVILKRSPWVAIESRALAKGQFFSDDISTQDLDKYYKTLQEESFRAFLEQLLPVSVNRKIATLVLGAQNDQIISVGEVKKTAAAFRTEAEIFPKMAHNMQVERGWEKVADRIICWLKTQRS